MAAKTARQVMQWVNDDIVRRERLQEYVVSVWKERVPRQNVEEMDDVQLLANVCGVTWSTARRWMTGKRTAPPSAIRLVEVVATYFEAW